MSHYTTTGPVRGSCGHRHRTLGGALRCLRRDVSGCRRQGGYSDRRLLDDSGAEIPTRPGERGDLEIDPD